MVKGIIAAKMSHQKAGVSKAAKGAVNEGDVPRAGKGTMTDAQFDKKQSSAHQTNRNLKASKEPHHNLVCSDN